jgi:hypothetical protein
LGTASGNLFPLAVILTQPPEEIGSTGSWCNRTASEIPLVVVLREPPVEISFHWRFFKPTASELSVINTTRPPPDRSCSSQPTSIGGDFGGPDFTKYKGEVLVFIFWKKVDKKGWFMFFCQFLFILAQF